MSHFLNVLIAAQEHPDTAFREHLSNKIDLWISSKKPKHSRQSIVKAILGCKGTPIEPFILRKKQFYIASILSMLAFTKEENQKVVRLMSEDTYGVNKGGCLLKDDLSFSYHENFYKGKKPKYKENNWYSCPWKYPFKKKNKIKANLTFSENGYKIKIDNINPEIVRWADIRTGSIAIDTGREKMAIEGLEENSFIFPEAKNFKSLGCRIGFEKRSLVIETKSTDDMLKMSVYLMRKSILILECDGRNNKDNYDTFIAVKLHPAIEENVELFVTVIPSYGFDKCGWIFQNSKGSPDIDESDKIKIMKDLYPANAWIDQKLMRSL